MRILFDQGTPAPLRRLLSGHEVATAYERGWSALRNGELLAAAKREGYDLLLTTDSHLKHQQNLALRSSSCSRPVWPRIERAAATIIQTIDETEPGSSREIEIPA